MERRMIGMMRWSVLPLLVAPVLVLVVGCGNTGGSFSGAPEVAESEPNDTFDMADVVGTTDKSASRTAMEVVVAGSISSRGDVDLFDLGALAVGDEVFVDVNRVDGNLDGAIAIFDAEGRLVFENDDEDFSRNLFDPRGRVTIRRESARFYLAMSHSPVAARLGSYEMLVSITPDGGDASPRSQVVLLDFDGGEADDPVFGNIVVGPLDAADISQVYEGRTQELKDILVARVREAYAGYDITFVTTDDGAPPEPPFTTVLFGGFNDFAFGVADSVDLYNMDRCDDGIIFTESFMPFSFGFIPTLEELAIGIGNVAAHETGHLLGLHHTTDATELMDERSPPESLLVPQTFHDAPLAPSVYEIGTQDASLLLAEILGATGA